MDRPERSTGQLGEGIASTERDWRSGSGRVAGSDRESIKQVPEDENSVIDRPM